MGSSRLLRSLGAALALALPAVVPAGVSGAHWAAFAPCPSSPAVLCGSVSVPLDYSGGTAGRLRLSVAERPAGGKPRGTILLIAGGPGEAATSIFDLHSTLWRSLFPGYTVAAYDDRGTGDSGALSCAGAKAARRCSAAIGPRRVFYGTHENVEDMDAVRRALGVDRIALFGISYGTKQALAYAFAYPTHVERLLLDSVVPPDGPEPLGTGQLRAITAALASICHGGACTAAGRDPASDFVRLANRLAARPLVATMPVYGTGWGPTRQRVRVDGSTLLALATASDLNTGIAEELPAAVSEALAGRPRLLEHVAALVAQQTSDDVNPAAFLATTCNDGPFPWQPRTPVSRRPPLLAAAVAKIGTQALGGLGSWAARGPAVDCLQWPAPAGVAPPLAGTAPDVPVLVLAGDRDVRTPLRDGAAVAERFRHGHLLVAPGVGHTVIGSSRCVDAAVRSWTRQKTPPARCQRVPLPTPPVPPLPASVAAATPIGRVSGLAGRTLGATVLTLREAEASWLTSYPGGWVVGLEGGLLAGEDFDVFRYSAYSDVPGLTLSGRLTFATSAGTLVPGSEHGIVAVGGSHAASGFLQVGDHRVFGVLGGRHVSARF